MYNLHYKLPSFCFVFLLPMSPLLLLYEYFFFYSFKGMSEPTSSTPQQPDIVQNVNSQDDGKMKKSVSTQTGQATQNDAKSNPSLLEMTSLEKNFQEVRIVITCQCFLI